MAALKNSFVRELDCEPSLYGRIWDGTIQLGPAFRWIERIWRRDDETLAQTRSLPADGDLQRYFHSGLLDSCLFHAIGPLLPASDVPWIPVGIDRIRVSGHPKGRLWCHAKLTSSGDRGQTALAHVRLSDDEATFIAEIENIHLMRAHRETLLRATSKMPDESLYKLEWRIAPGTIEARPASPGRVNLIFADSGGIGNSLSRFLEEHGETVAVVARGESFERRFDVPVGRVLYLWGLDETDEAQQTGCAGALGLAQMLATYRGSVAPELVIVTQGAQPAGPSAAVVSPAQAPLWGLGRAVALEQPANNCQLVDLDPDAQADDSAKALYAELLSTDKENQVAFRGGVRFVPRVVRDRKGFEGSPAPLALRDDATYLITGGLGVLGIRIARWMADRGARHMTLVGRTAPGAVSASAIGDLQKAGVIVSVVLADVALGGELRRAIGEVSTEFPLRGIVHAAGVLDDGMLAGQDWQRFAAVMAPKVAGAWNLHKLTADLPLDFFVLFSSVASIIGPPGQANYASANAFLDAMAHYRRGLGLAAIVINWGPWAESGMAAKGGSSARRMLALDPLTPERGLGLLEQFIMASPTQAIVLPINWARLAQQTDVAQPPILSELIREMRQRTNRPVAGADASVDLAQLLESAPPRKRRALVAANVKQLAMQLMGCAPGDPFDPRQSLLEMGMDSLMATDLRNSLQAALARQISPTLVFDNPSADGITDYLLKDVLFMADPHPAREASAGANGTAKSAIMAQIGQLSDEEAARSIAEELAAMHGSRGE